VKEWYDFVDCAGDSFAVAKEQVEGVYDSRVLTDRVLQTIDQHNSSRSLYMYIAYHNVS
jgi:hypothetical protein